jgi:hypothetical protein
LRRRRRNDAVTFDSNWRRFSHLARWLVIFRSQKKKCEVSVIGVKLLMYCWLCYGNRVTVVRKTRIKSLTTFLPTFFPSMTKMPPLTFTISSN